MATISTDYLVIGNSAAGVTAAEELRKLAPSSSITIVGEEPYPAYGRPLISYMIEGKTSEDHIWLKDDDFYERLDLHALLGPDSKVVELRPEKHEAVLANGDVVAYGKCLLATGSIPFVPPIKGLDCAENVHSFMSLDDAKGLWAAAEESQKAAADEGRTSRIVVIGAGLIGLKAAEAISRYTDEVLVLELAPRILPAVLDADGASVLQKRLARENIVCMPGVSASELVVEGGNVVAAKLTNGEEVPCDIVVAAVGVRPNSSLAVDAGAEQGRGLVCDDHLCTTLPDVYAAGDIVQVTDVLDGSQHPLALWPNAVQQGRAAAHFMAGDADAEPYEGSFAVNAVDFFDASLLTSGIINPPEDDDAYSVRVVSDGDTYAKFVTRDNRLVGYILLNRPDNAGIYTSLIENCVSLDTVDPDIFEGAPQNMYLSSGHRWKRLHMGYPADRDMDGRKKVECNA